LRNAKGGQSTGPLETGRAWDNASNALPSGGCRGPNDRLNCSGAETDCAGVPYRTCTLLPGGVLNEATPMFADIEAWAVRNIFLLPLTCLIIVQ
jgi:hypothetical protein